MVVVNPNLIPNQQICGYMGLVWILNEEPHTIKHKEIAWDSPQNPNQTLIQTCSLADQEIGWANVWSPSPEPYQAICPQHGEGTLSLGKDTYGEGTHGLYVDEDKGLFPTILAQFIVGSVGGGLTGI